VINNPRPALLRPIEYKPGGAGLQVRGLTKSYGGVRALSEFTATFEVGTITAVVGANGAGKTTLLDCLSGRIPSSEGEIELDGRRIQHLSADARARLGIGRSFQDGELFNQLTVREILYLAYDLLGRPLLRGLLTQSSKEREYAAEAVLGRFNLKRVADEKLKNLSLGMCRVTMLACLYASKSKVWLLDEPASGLARAEVDRFGPLLSSLIASDPERCVVIVEHDANLVRASADRVILLESGRLIGEGRKDTAAWADILEGRSSFRRRIAGGVDSAIRSPQPSPNLPQSELAARDIHVRYGMFEAVRGVSISVPVGEIRCLVGTNGAGKSTIMRCLAGILSPTSGSVSIQGSIIPSSAHERVRRNRIVLVQGGRTVFPHLSVDENLRLTRQRAPQFDALEIFPSLRGKRNQLAGSLSGGEQQMLAISRALQLQPRYLLLDELSLGLAEKLVDQLLTILTAETRAGRIGILLVEQDYAQALSWSRHAYVLTQGQLSFSGLSSDAFARPDLFRPVFMPSDDTDD
jgi:branched-chain amino acid transport system ATP-binding protein